MIPLGIYLDVKKSNKEYANQREESERWLKEQMALPKSYVTVYLKSGGGFITKPFQPTIHDLHIATYKMQSKDHARSFIERCVKLGRYWHSETDQYFPMCGIESMDVVS